MHRTQIVLDEWQYQALKARAEKEGRSISGVVREILSEALGRSKDRIRQLESIEGIGEDRAARGREHDRYLYEEAPRSR
jgi:plasmid stability protein